MTDTVHPRPQLTRPEWTDLRGPWQFAFDDEDVGLTSGWFRADTPDFARTITVPFPPESAASGIHDPSMHRVVWYRRRFSLGVPGDDGRVLLHFGAVDYRASVWVGGQLVASHEGGHTPFSADITAALHPSGEQVVTVRAEDEPGDLAQPRGKQGWKATPHAIWYKRTTGIWQTVWLETVPERHVSALRWTPDLDRGGFDLTVRVAGGPGTGRVRAVLTLHGERMARVEGEVTGGTARLFLPVDPHRLVGDASRVLWSPRHPNLFDAEITLLDEEDEVLDTVSSYAGLRSAEATNGRFHLNGRPFYPRLVLAQNYWPESHLAAPSGEALRREAELVRELGFDGVRLHQKVEDPRFLYWCDRLGLLVWGEMPSALVFSPEMQRRLTREWLEVLERDHSHPCIVTWVPLNESWGVPNLERDAAQRDFVRALYHLTRSLDPTRPVIGNDGWQLVAGDIAGVHDYTRSGAAITARYGTREALAHTLRHVQPGHRPLLPRGRELEDEPVMLTEFGGVSVVPEEGERWWGYGAVGGEAFLETYAELVSAVLACEAIVGFCYTQLTDTEQESNGLLRADRTPKVDVARLRAANRQHPASMPADAMLETFLAANAANARLDGAGRGPGERGPA